MLEERDNKEVRPWVLGRCCIDDFLLLLLWVLHLVLVLIVDFLAYLF